MNEENSPSRRNLNTSENKPKLDRGRWRSEEHELFLKGLKLYGRDWKKIESLVGTRTGPQIRSHAQKYFNKINKEKEANDLSSDISLMNKESSPSISSLLDLNVTKKGEHDKVQKSAFDR